MLKDLLKKTNVMPKLVMAAVCAEAVGVVILSRGFGPWERLSHQDALPSRHPVHCANEPDIKRSWT